MPDIKSSARLLLCILGVVMANACFAAGDAIEIVKSEGKVTNNVAGKQKEKETRGSKSAAPTRNVLATGPDGRAVVRVGKSGYIVLEKNSKVEVDNSGDHAGFLRVITGMIYFAINAIKGEQKVEVRTTTSTIGVRGTRFMVVDMPDRNEIDMRKGLVSVTSPEGDFEIHKQAEQNEFEAYKQEAKDAIAQEQRKFEEYKANTQKEFVEYKREFSLGANRMASFDGKQVQDRPLSAESVKDLESAESYADEWLKQVND
jgi:FecR protein